MRSSTPGVSRVLALIAAFVAASLVTGTLVAGLFIPAVGATGALTRASVDYFNSLPADLSRPPLAEESVMYAKDGRTVIAKFYDENRITVPLAQIAPVMRQAIVAIEDSRFYEHGGVDPHGLLRAFVNNQVGGGVQGASTLTQQYIKNYNVEKCVAAGDQACAQDAVRQTYSRKLQEMRTAIALEKQLNKNQILEGYLNIALFGDNTFGVEAASLYYFNTHASKLSLVQAATLAGLVQSPAAYSPFEHPKAAVTRRNEVLNRMFQLKMITQQQLDSAEPTPLKTNRHVAYNGCVTAGTTAYFCEYVIRTLETDPAYSYLGSTEAQRITSIKRGGYRFITTLDPNIQRIAAKTVVKHVPVNDPSKVATAAVTVQPGTGYVLAMAQNRIYFPDNKPGDTTLNYAVDKPLGGSVGFPTGSTFKAFTLATWLQDGKSVNDVVNASDRPNGRPFSDFTACGQQLIGGTYHYANSADGEGSGSMSVLKATANSVNTGFVQMETQLDLCDIVKTATSLGVHLAAPKDASDNCGHADTALPSCQPSLTLGPNNISPLTMASAYAAFAADGSYCPPRPLLTVLDRNGKKQKVMNAPCRQGVTADVAHGVTYALKHVLTDGTGAGLGIGRPAAGKTGTSDKSANGWFVGYTAQLSTAVWTANPNSYKGHADTYGQLPLEGVRINGHYYSAVFGATISGAVWHDVMSAASSGLPSQDWPDPPFTMLKSAGKKVPDVTGQTVQQATATLTTAGFQVTVAGIVAGPAPAGTVASTSPAAGSLAAPGSTISLNISDGSQGGPGNGHGNGGGGGGGAGGGGGGFPVPFPTVTG